VPGDRLERQHEAGEVRSHGREDAVATLNASRTPLGPAIARERERACFQALSEERAGIELVTSGLQTHPGTGRQLTVIDKTGMVEPKSPF
jgi:hypothetical protein